MTYSPKAIANYFIEKARASGKNLSPMKLQKLVYFAHGWHLAIYNEPLINEKIQAWKFGPVIQSLYHECKSYGNNHIHEPIKDINWMPGKAFSLYIPVVEEAGGEKAKALLDRVWDIYSVYNPLQLSAMTHEKGSPWDQIVSRYGGQVPMGASIPDELIRTHFVSQAQRHVATPG